MGRSSQERDAHIGFSHSSEKMEEFRSALPIIQKAVGVYDRVGMDEVRSAKVIDALRSTEEGVAIEKSYLHALVRAMKISSKTGKGLNLQALYALVTTQKVDLIKTLASDFQLWRELITGAASKSQELSKEAERADVACKWADAFVKGFADTSGLASDKEL